MRGGVICCSVTALVLLLVMCFSSLEYTELGLDYSFFSSSVDDRGYENGRYFLGLGHSFVKFPSVVQSIEFSSGGVLRSRTADGLEVNLEVSFQYQFNVSSIFDVYEKFGTSYESIYINMAMDIITTTSTYFNATYYFTNRSLIAYDMERSLRSNFENFAFVTIPFFQLRSVGLPKEFDDAIRTTEMAAQDCHTASAEMDTMGVSMETQVLKAQQSAVQIELGANGTAQQTLLMVQAYVDQFKLTQDLQAEAFVSIFEELDKDETRFLDYLSVRAMRDHPAALTVVSMPNGAVAANPTAVI